MSQHAVTLWLQTSFGANYDQWAFEPTLLGRQKMNVNKVIQAIDKGDTYELARHLNANNVDRIFTEVDLVSVNDENILQQTPLSYAKKKNARPDIIKFIEDVLKKREAKTM
jgi:hypothetical protein